MIEAYTAADVRAAEEPFLARERSFHDGLMHRAATALAGQVRAELRARGAGVYGATVVGLVGPGNNGGDALHALAVLAARGADVLAVLTAAGVHEGGLAALHAAGGRSVSVAQDGAVAAAGDGGASGPTPQVWAGDALAEAFAADVVVDGLLGIGGRGGLRGAAAVLVDRLQALNDDAPAGVRPVVVAVDLPSGTGADDGTVPGPVLRADVTVTFGAVKPALLLPPACHSAGRVEAVDLGLVGELTAQGRSARVVRLEESDVQRVWPVPGRVAHKYTRGVVGVVAGSAPYPGAAVLTVAGATGVGCGMVRYVGPSQVRDQVVAAHPEVVAGGETAVRVQAWVVGPGVADDEQAARVREVLEGAAAGDVPVVVDAGALEHVPGRVPATVVLTPHAGELARFLTARGMAVTREEVEAEPVRWARTAHDMTGATVLLKGAVTLVAGAGPDGGSLVVAQGPAPAWLATAGAGDVLAGVLGGLLAGVGAQPGHGWTAGLVMQVVAAGVHVHGRTATHANPGGPVTSPALAGALPGVVARLLDPAPSPRGRSARRCPAGRSPGTLGP